MLEHAESGKGDAIVLLHGFALDHRMWEGELAAFGADHRVVAPTLPDFGPRPRRPGVTASRAVVALLDELGIERAHVVGLSLGGAVAIDLALAFAPRVRSLTLVDALLRGRPSGITGWPAIAEHAKAGAIDRAREAWLAEPLFGSLSSKAAAHSKARAMVFDYDGAHWRGEADTTFEVAKHEPELAQLRVPTTVVVGQHDIATFRAMSDAYAALIPGATQVVIEGAGHLSNMEEPAQFHARLRESLSRARARMEIA